MKILILTLVLLCSALPVLAGEVVLDNFNENCTCCVEFETWRMGTARMRTLCAGPQRRERFTDALAAIGKLRVSCQSEGDDDSRCPNARFTPEGIYSPLTGYRIEAGPSGSVNFSRID